MKPYYQDNLVTLYHGDARAIIPALDTTWGACITDPVWPNALPCLAGAADPAGLFGATLEPLVGRIERLVVQLGCDSDPRFLAAVPAALPFRRTCWLRYARPSYTGRLLKGSEVAYCFGEWPAPRKGAIVLPGENTNTEGTARKGIHPCPRRLSHVTWLASYWGGQSVIDPFGGSGTTALACAYLEIPCTLIEIEEKYCEEAARRLSTRQDSLALAGATDD